MDRAEIKARIADILKYDCWGKEITFNDLPDDGLEVNLNCFALTATAAGQIAALADETRRGCILTIADINNPTLQIRF